MFKKTSYKRYVKRFKIFETKSLFVSLVNITIMDYEQETELNSKDNTPNRVPIHCVTKDKAQSCHRRAFFRHKSDSTLPAVDQKVLAAVIGPHFIS